MKVDDTRDCAGDTRDAPSSLFAPQDASFADHGQLSCPTASVRRLAEGEDVVDGSRALFGAAYFAAARLAGLGASARESLAGVSEASACCRAGSLSCWLTLPTSRTRKSSFSVLLAFVGYCQRTGQTLARRSWLQSRNSRSIRKLGGSQTRPMHKRCLPLAAPRKQRVHNRRRVPQTL